MEMVRVAIAVGGGVWGMGNLGDMGDMGDTGGKIGMAGSFAAGRGFAWFC
jgi:hypothetical protein